MKMVSIRLPENVIKELRNYAKNREITKQEAYREIIKKGLKINSEAQNKQDKMREINSKNSIENKYVVQQLYRLFFDKSKSKYETPDDEFTELKIKKHLNAASHCLVQGVVVSLEYGAGVLLVLVVVLERPDVGLILLNSRLSNGQLCNDIVCGLHGLGLSHGRLCIQLLLEHGHLRLVCLEQAVLRFNGIKFLFPHLPPILLTEVVRFAKFLVLGLDVGVCLKAIDAICLTTLAWIHK